MSREVLLSEKPQRIVSLVPSQTELLYDLGLENEVVGITKFCIHPKHWEKSKINIGGTKKFNFEKIDDLAPDLIIGNKEENYKEGVEKLSKKYPVWMSDILTLEDSLKMISSIGKITGRENKSSEIIKKIKSNFSHVPSFKGKRIAYFIWKEPYMVVGGSTFINNLFETLDLENVFKHKKRYFEVNIEEINSMEIDYIFLSSEPYPFKEKNCKEIRNLFPNTIVTIVDGEMFSWYGSRLLKSPDYFRVLYESIELTS